MEVQVLVTVSCKVDRTKGYFDVSNPLPNNKVRRYPQWTCQEATQKSALLSAAAYEAEKATGTAPGFIVLFHAATRNAPTIVHSHAIRAAFACRRSRSILSPFRRTAVQERVRVRRSIPVSQSERTSRTSVRAMRRDLDTVPVGTPTEYAWRRRNSIRVDVSRLAWTYVGSRELLLACPLARRCNRLSADVTTNSARGLPGCWFTS